MIVILAARAFEVERFHSQDLLYFEQWFVSFKTPNAQKEHNQSWVYRAPAPVVTIDNLETIISRKNSGKTPKLPIMIQPRSEWKN